MSSGPVCRCPGDRIEKWRVLQRMCNHSAFNAYRYTPSDYSSVLCLHCHRVWRTNGVYVSGIPDLDDKDRKRWLRS